MPDSEDAFQPFERPEVPEHCPQPDRPCQWERERRDFNSRLTRIERMMTDIHAALAVGSERFKNAAHRDQQTDRLERDLAALAATVDKLAGTVVLLRAIVFGGIGFTLISVLGALLTLVLVKGAA